MIAKTFFIREFLLLQQCDLNISDAGGKEKFHTGEKNKKRKRHYTLILPGLDGII
jgi:hypothetical protein